MCIAYTYIMHSIFLTTSHTHALDGACCGMCKMGDNLIRIESFFPYHPTDELLTWLSGYNVKLDTDSVKSTSLGGVKNGRHSDEGH